MPELKRKIQSVINNPDLKQGNPPPIRPITTGLVIKAPPESAWDRRVKIARQFPKTMTSKRVYERLGLDSNKPADKRAVSRVMKAAGFVARRGRRGALWMKVSGRGSREVYPPLSPFHIIRVVSLSLLSIRNKRQRQLQSPWGEETDSERWAEAVDCADSKGPDGCRFAASQTRALRFYGKTKSGQKAVREARRAAGFRAEQTSQSWTWVRKQETD
jgi:hypothetical protein